MNRTSKILLITAVTLSVIILGAASVAVIRANNNNSEYNEKSASVVTQESTDIQAAGDNLNTEISVISENSPDGFSDETTETTLNPEATDADSTSVSGDDIINVMYLGVDLQENRSDTMMVISVNKTTNTISVISLCRDTEVEYPDFPIRTKLGYAYKWGYMGILDSSDNVDNSDIITGPDSSVTNSEFNDRVSIDRGSRYLMEIVNNNFHTDLQYYMNMWFEDVADIVDYLGGVDIELNADEAVYMQNNYPELVEGVNHLNGAQAVWYSRIRKSNDSDCDYFRVHRQQKVVAQIFNILKNMPSSEYLGFIEHILESDMSTNMTLDMLVDIAQMDMSTITLQCYTIPDPDYETDVWGGWVDVDTSLLGENDPWLDAQSWDYIFDLEAAGARLRSIIG